MSCACKNPIISEPPDLSQRFIKHNISHICQHVFIGSAGAEWPNVNCSIFACSQNASALGLRAFGWACLYWNYAISVLIWLLIPLGVNAVIQFIGIWVTSFEHWTLDRGTLLLSQVEQADNSIVKTLNQVVLIDHFDDCRVGAGRLAFERLHRRQVAAEVRLLSFWGFALNQLLCGKNVDFSVHWVVCVHWRGG